MEHVVGQMYHHYDTPFNPANVACGLRDSVYILSEWRAGVKGKERTRCLRKDSEGKVHDIIKFHFGITEESVTKFVQHLAYLNTTVIQWDKQPIWLEIMSTGGSVPSGIEMRCACENSFRPVIPIVSGLCASAATFAWTANQKYRYMQNASILLIHQMSEMGTNSSAKLVDKEIGYENMKLWQKQIEQFYYGVNRHVSGNWEIDGPSDTTLMTDEDLDAEKLYHEANLSKKPTAKINDHRNHILGTASPKCAPDDTWKRRRGAKHDEEIHKDNDRFFQPVKSDPEEYKRYIDKTLMAGQDRYIDPREAWEWGLCTKLFTTYAAEEEEGCPAHFKEPDA